MKSQISFTENLCKKLYDLRDEFVDIEIKTNDNKSIRAHKTVLLTYPFFQNKIDVNNNNQQIFVDIPEAQLKLIIEYLYTGKMNLKEICETKLLFEIAKKFGFKEIQEYSSKNLMKIL